MTQGLILTKQNKGFSFKRFEFNREGIKPKIIVKLYISYDKFSIREL